MSIKLIELIRAFFNYAEALKKSFDLDTQTDLKELEKNILLNEEEKQTIMEFHNYLYTSSLNFRRTSEEEAPLDTRLKRIMERF